MTIEIVDLPEDLPINSMVDLSSQLRKRLPEGQKNWALQVFFLHLDGWNSRNSELARPSF